MNERRAPVVGDSGGPLRDELIRAGLPEIKLALGEVIDRENVRPLPPKYARLLPETLLAVVLRADAAEALRPIASDIERELTDSCNRHGSLYDRSYRVELQRTDDPDAPFYAVRAQAGKDEGEGVEDDEVSGELEAEAESRDERQEVRSRTSLIGGAPALPVADADATRVDLGPPRGWTPHQWMLIVEREGEAQEAFRILEPRVSVGRGARDPALRPSISISDAPHVSRRQLVLRWQERDGAPGFRVYNVGLNTVHLPGRAIAGAQLRGDSMDVESVGAEHTGWLPPGVPLRIGDEGPTLRVEEVPPGPDEEAPVDPDATVFR